MKKPKRIPLSQEQAKRLLRDQDWKLFEILQADWSSIPDFQRREDMFACIGSADPYDPRLLNMINRCVAGFDQLVYESEPKLGEPEGNAYHWLVQESGREDYPYVLRGPFYSETRVPHHFDFKALDAYDNDLN